MMRLSLQKKRLDLLLLFSLAATLFIPVVAPQLRLTFFAPFLIAVCYQKKLATVLWIALLCGLMMDLLAEYEHFGLYAFSYSLTMALMYPQVKHFFADSLSTLPIMTFLFGLLSTLIMGLLLYTIEMKNIFSWPWIPVDLFLMPLEDAAYAFVCFILPALLFGKRQRTGKEYFLSR